MTKSTPTLAERILALPCLGTMSQFATLDDLKLYQSAFKEGLAQAAALAAEQEGQETVAYGWVNAGTDRQNTKYATLNVGPENPWVDGANAFPVYLHAHRAAQEADAPNWISVDECLPPDGDDVIAWAGDHIVIERWAERHECPVGWSSATIPIGPAWDDHEFEDISHWMPLPDAPVSTTTPKG